MNIKEARRRNLRNLIDALIKDGTFLLQENFAEAVGIDKSYLSQMLMDPTQKGARGVSEAKARQIERMLNIELSSLDKFEDQHPLGFSEISSGILRPIATGDDDCVAEYVVVPVFDVRAACGMGYTNQDELIKGGLVFKESFLRKKGISPRLGGSGIVYSDGDSMQPSINHNDVVLIDRSVTTLEGVVSGKAYAFVASRELRIKRIFKNINGSLRISSDNPDKTTYPDELIPLDDISMIEIKGAVKWRGGAI